MTPRQRMMFEGAASGIRGAAELMQSDPQSAAQLEIVAQLLTDARLYLAQLNEELKRIGP